MIEVKETKESSYPEIISRNFTATRNACKLCAPLGAGIAFRGIEGCIPLIHGSQGCSTYIRRYVISHFKEPIDIASSNFSEQSAIFGGGDNLKTALDNLIRQYRPEAIGIATTCLSETIGDDVSLYINEYGKGKKGPKLSRSSSMPPPPVTGGPTWRVFMRPSRATVKALAAGGPQGKNINILPGFLSAEDLRHLKEILADFGLAYTLLPDYSETLDGESWADYQKLSAGGTPIKAIRDMGRAQATIQFGRSLTGLKTAAAFLEEKFKVPAMTLGIPMGIRETDLFMEALQEVTGLTLPPKYEKERGRLVDAYIDGHKYVFGKRAVIYGEADFVAAMASWLDEIGIVPVLCATGACTGKFKETVRSGLKNCREEPLICEDTDFADHAGDLPRHRGRSRHRPQQRVFPLQKTRSPFGAGRLSHPRPDRRTAHPSRGIPGDAAALRPDGQCPYRSEPGTISGGIQLYLKEDS